MYRQTLHRDKENIHYVQHKISFNTQSCSLITSGNLVTIGENSLLICRYVLRFPLRNSGSIMRGIPSGESRQIPISSTMLVCWKAFIRKHSSRNWCKSDCEYSSTNRKMTWLLTRSFKYSMLIVSNSKVQTFYGNHSTLHIAVNKGCGSDFKLHRRYNYLHSFYTKELVFS